MAAVLARPAPITACDAHHFRSSATPAFLANPPKRYVEHMPAERPDDVIAHHQRVEHDLRRKAETAQLLLDAARYLGETLEIERVYYRFHELLADAIQHDGVVVSSFDERESLIRCEYAWVEGEHVDPTTLPELKFSTAGGMQSEVIRTGKPLLENDV